MDVSSPVEHSATRHHQDRGDDAREDKTIEIFDHGSATEE